MLTTFVFIKKQNFKITKINLLEKLQEKKFRWLSFEKKFISSKINLSSYFCTKYKLNYFTYLRLTRRILKISLVVGKVFGCGLTNYISLDTSKRNKSGLNEKYNLKLLSWKDSRFFYGSLLKCRRNFTSYTIWLRNVFYNEIVEKTFLLFSNWSGIVSYFSNLEINQLKKRLLKKKKKNFFFLRKKPRVFSKITLKNLN